MKKLKNIVLQKGDIVEFADGETLQIYALDGENAQFPDKVKSIKRPTGYETIYEAQQPILDKEEKEYLENVIRPFRNKVEHIAKIKANSTEEFIDFRLADNDYACLPVFKKDKMYKGMEVYKRYTLKELGLFEGDMVL